MRFHQFRLLVWKNYVLQKRSWIATIFELLLPTLLSLILISIRVRVEATPLDQPTKWDPFTVNSLDKQLISKLNNRPSAAFTPKNSDTERVMSRVKELLRLTEINGFNSEDEMVTFMQFHNVSADHSRNYFVGVVFDDTSPENSKDRVTHFKCTLRFSAKHRVAKLSLLDLFDSDNWYTRLQFPLEPQVKPRQNSSKRGGSPGYSVEGFLPMQWAISRALVDVVAPNRSSLLDGVDVLSQRIPYPPYQDDAFVLILQQQLSFIFILSFVFHALMIAREVTQEKEHKLKESMKMMGLAGWVHWLAWFFKYVVFLLLTCALITCFLSIPAPIYDSAGNFTNTYKSVIGKTDPSLLYVFLATYSCSIITFSFFISTLFKTANSGAAAGGILFFLSSFPYMFLQQRYNSLSLVAGKLLPSLIPNVAMSFGCRLIGVFEGTGAGAQWSSFGSSPTIDDSLSLLHIVAMFLIDSIFYMLLTWYIEAVYPGDFGVPQPWYFPVTKTYWFGGSRTQQTVTSTTPVLSNSTGTKRTTVPTGMLEVEPENITCGIAIDQLTKIFNKRKIAVDQLTLNAYEGQITCLLGHNGAGKTTTMFMLTGFLPPTEGTAVVNGYDVRQQIDMVRQGLGLCPQHDVLFDKLTCREHLEFFGSLKNVPNSDLETKLMQLLRELKLDHKIDAKAKTLSGGQRRKLSVAIALIGDCRTLILDEPTSGMDPDARKLTGEILQKYKAGRTMLLTTHFMEEADQLADRIAIVSGGQLKCCGSSLFLKNKFGHGYQLTVVRKATATSSTLLDSLVKSHVPNAQSQLSNSVQGQQVYTLPYEHSGQFQKLFEMLEKHRDELGIQYYNMSVSTMEEVFIRAGGEERFAEDDSIPSSSSTAAQGETAHSLSGQQPDLIASSVAASRGDQPINTNSTPNVVIAEGEPTYSETEVLVRKRKRHRNPLLGYLACSQFGQTLLKRVRYTIRSPVVTVPQLFIPLIFAVLVSIVYKTIPVAMDAQPLTLTLSNYHKPVVVYALNSTRESMNSSAAQLAASYERYALRQPAVSRVIYSNNYSDAMKWPHLSQLQNVLLQLNDELGMAKFDSRYMIAADFGRSTNGSSTVATAVFNNQAFHSIAISLQAVLSAIVSTVTDEPYELEFVNHPLPRTVVEDQQTSAFIATASWAFSFGTFITFSFSFVGSCFCLFLIRERATKAKHCQRIAGLNLLPFWSATLLWDLATFMIPCLLMLLSFGPFNITNYWGAQRTFELILLCLIYGWALIPFMYLWSLMFKTPSVGFVWATIFNIFSGVGTYLAVVILQIPQINLVDLSKALDWTFKVFLPNYCFTSSLSSYYINHDQVTVCEEFQQYCPLAKLENKTFACCKDFCGDQCFDWQSNYLAWQPNGIGQYLVFLTLHGLVYLSLLSFFESGSARRFKRYLVRRATHTTPSSAGRSDAVERQLSTMSVDSVLDDDVISEQQRIEETPMGQLAASSLLVVKNLHKYYDGGKVHAVRGISFAVDKGQCFGLLGVNGAGKTSTFKMMIGDETISSGTALVCGLDIEHDFNKLKRLVGYCPQFDALIDHLTGREMLEMFATYRGMDVRSDSTQAHIDGLIDSLNLSRYADVKTKGYSGGNKRKLSCALALVGNPQLVFLDEPSTGVDPISRRMMWSVLSRFRQDNHTIVLTSHTMNECEALCSRLVIMVNGQLKCLGSPEHLKAKFSQGYTILCKLNVPISDDDQAASVSQRLATDSLHGAPSTLVLAAFQQFMAESFANRCHLRDTFQGYFHYHIDAPELTASSDSIETEANCVSLAAIFSKLEEAKSLFPIDYYSVAQTSLEQIFMYFANQQAEPEHVD